MNYFIKVFNHTILQLPACMLPPLLLLFIYILTAQHMGSQCSDQGSNLQPLHWKVVLTTGLAQKSLFPSINNSLLVSLDCFSSPLHPQDLACYREYSNEQYLMNPYVLISLSLNSDKQNSGYKFSWEEPL